MWRRLAQLWSSPRVILRQILALDDAPRAIALGAAIGVTIGLTPTVGLQTIEVLLFAVLTRRFFYFNRTAALLLIYLSNPLTIVPIYYGLYWIGSCFVPGTVTIGEFRQILEFDGFAGWLTTVSDLMFRVGLPLAIGTVIVAPLGGFLSYPTTIALIRWYRGTPPEAKLDREEQIESAKDAVQNSDPVSIPFRPHCKPSEGPMRAVRAPVESTVAFKR